MTTNDNAYFKGIELNEGAYFYSYPEHVDEVVKKRDIRNCFRGMARQMILQKLQMYNGKGSIIMEKKSPFVHCYFFPQKLYLHLCRI